MVTVPVAISIPQSKLRIFQEERLVVESKLILFMQTVHVQQRRDLYDM